MNEKDLWDEYIQKSLYHEKGKLLSNNHVLLARDFQYQLD